MPLAHKPDRRFSNQAANFTEKDAMLPHHDPLPPYTHRDEVIGKRFTNNNSFNTSNKSLTNVPYENENPP